MDIYEFNQLLLDRLEKLVWKGSIFSINRVERNFGLTLYRLFDFDAAVHLNNGINKIEKIRPCKSMDLLDSHLYEIGLTDFGN